MAEDSWLKIAAIALIVVIAYGFFTSGKLPTQQQQTTVTQDILTKTADGTTGIICLASDTATRNIRIKSSTDTTKEGYINGTGYYYPDDKPTSISSSTTGTYTNITVTCGVPGKYVNLGRSNSAGSAEISWPAFKGEGQSELVAPALWHQIKVRARGADYASWYVFNNNTTTDVILPTTLPTSKMRITADAANSSHNLTAGNTLNLRLIVTNTNATAQIGDKTLVGWLTFDFSDIQEDAVALKRGGALIPLQQSGAFFSGLASKYGVTVESGQASWADSKSTEEDLYGDFGNIGLGGEIEVYISLPAESSIGTMTNAEFWLKNFGAYRNKGGQIVYGVVDDTSSNNFIGHGGWEFVIPLATGG